MPDSKITTIDIVNIPPDISKSALRQFLRDVIDAACDNEGSLCLAFVSDEKMRELNREFRNIDKPTDVLSFPLNESTPEGFYLGDVIISLPTAARQARDADLTLTQEVFYLCAHGVMHLCGYDHETDQGEMLRLEKTIRQELVARYC